MRHFQKLAVLFLAILILCSLAVPALAVEEDIVDLDRKGSITVLLDLPRGLQDYGTLTIYRVGDIIYNQVDDPDTRRDDRGFQFTPVEELADSRLSFLNLNRRGLADETAMEVMRCRMDEIETQRIRYNRANRSYQASFDNLTPGLYLIVQYDPAEGYYVLSPFLVSVPYMVNGEYVYDVTASAKSELEKEPPTETTKPSGGLPQTGQLNWPVPTLAALGMMLIAIGWVLRNKKQEENA